MLSDIHVNCSVAIESLTIYLFISDYFVCSYSDIIILTLFAMMLKLGDIFGPLLCMKKEVLACYISYFYAMISRDKEPVRKPYSYGKSNYGCAD
jgi:hypothetical protein